MCNSEKSESKEAILMAVSKLIQSLPSTCLHKGESKKNKNLFFSYFGLMIMKSTRTCPEKDKFFENGFDFLTFFTPYYYVMLNDDKLWQA